MMRTCHAGLYNLCTWHAVGCGHSGSGRHRWMRTSKSYRNSTCGVIACAVSPMRHRESRRNRIAPGWFSDGVLFWKHCRRGEGNRRCTGHFLVSNQVTVQIPISKWTITYRVKNRSKLAIPGNELGWNRKGNRTYQYSVVISFRRVISFW
jgi:hypothetical protein